MFHRGILPIKIVNKRRRYTDKTGKCSVNIPRWKCANRIGEVMRTIEWEAPALASLAAAHWLVAYERENSPRKRVRYENEIEFDGVAYMLMCEIELVEREHKAVSMMCGIEPQYTDMPVRIIGNMGKAIGEILPVLNNFLDSYGVIYV